MVELEQHTNQSLKEADAALREEHNALHSLLDRLDGAAGAAEVTAVLKELVPKLKGHFAKEEHPGGLYDRMGATEQHAADDLRKLMDDHYRILSSIRSAQLDIAPDEAAHALGFARELAGWLRDHERREHDLVQRILAG